MPVWYRDYRDLEGVQIVGLIQEQHPERCRLFMQWQRLDFPILADPLNRLGVYAVPLMWAIDEHGVVRKTRPDAEWIRGEFVKTDYPEPERGPHVEAPSPGVAAFLEQDWDAAVAAFDEAVAGDEGRAELWFRLGCALRARHDSEARRPGDFQRAIAAWTTAVRLHPENYIFRRRLQQYGPRLGKPYPFYDWVADAQAALIERGERLPELRVALEGAELAAPIRGGAHDAATDGDAPAEPDPRAAIAADHDGLVAFEGVVAPSPVAAGTDARLYLRFTPSAARAVTFDDEAGPLVAWLEPPASVGVDSRLHRAAPEPGAAPSATRTVEVELRVPPDTPPGPVTVAGYALYFVCEGVDGACSYRRQDFAVPLEVTAAAPERR